MNKFNTGDKSLDTWLKFYHGTNLSSTKFLNLLKKLDKTFLTTSPPKDVEDEINTYLPDNGVLELDFKKVAYDKVEKNTDAKTRIVLSMINNVNFEPWKVLYGPLLTEVIENSLIEGDYECLGIEFEKIVYLAIEKNLIDREEFMGIAILRGVLLGSRYGEETAQAELAKLVKKNKLKLALGL